MLFIIVITINLTENVMIKILFIILLSRDPNSILLTEICTKSSGSQTCFHTGISREL